MTQRRRNSAPRDSMLADFAWSVGAVAALYGAAALLGGNPGSAAVMAGLALLMVAIAVVDERVG